jgi:hypothetical protein
MSKAVDEHHKKTRMVAVAALVVGVLGLGVAFAALSTTLYINGTAKIKNSSWDVHWAGLNCTPSGEAAVKSFDITDGANDDDTVTVDVEFKAGNDTVVCNVNAVNSGSLNAKLSGFTSSLTALNDINVTASLVYGASDASAGSAPADNDTLNAGDSRPMKLTLTYTGTLVGTDSDSKTFSYTLPYTQANQ